MSDEAGRVTLSGQQILASHPDSGVVRTTMAGEQILADAPELPIRVTACALEVLVSGAYIPPGRATLIGEQLLASVPPLPLRVSASAIEMLVAGAYIPPSRATTVGEQILAKTPPEPLRVSASAIELLVGIDYSFAPGQVRNTHIEATLGAAYPTPDQSFSEVWASALSQSAGAATVYTDEGSDGRAYSLDLISTTASPILDWAPAGRFYEAYVQTSVLSDDWLSPDAPQSDLTITHIDQAAAIASTPEVWGSDLTVTHVDQAVAGVAVYPDKDEAQSTAKLHGAQVALTAESPDWLAPDLPQSDLYVSHLQLSAGLPSTPASPGSDLTVTWVDQGVAIQSTPASPGSDLFVDAVIEQAGVKADYPASYAADATMHGMQLSATTRAEWVGEYQTQLRAHGVLLQSTLPAVEGVYVDPDLVMPSVEVSYLTNCIGFASTQALGGGPSIEVSRLTQAAAQRAYYPDPDAPESQLTVNSVDVVVAYRDDTFGDFAPDPQAGLPVISIELIYERN